MVSYGNPTVPATQYAQAGFAGVAMFFAFVVSGQVSGGQANPVITISLMFTRGSNVTVLNSIIYIVSQFIGSIVAGAVGNNILMQLTEQLIIPTLTPTHRTILSQWVAKYSELSCS